MSAKSLRLLFFLINLSSNVVWETTSLPPLSSHRQSKKKRNKEARMSKTEGISTMSACSTARQTNAMHSALQAHSVVHTEKKRAGVLKWTKTIKVATLAPERPQSVPKGSTRG